MLSFLVPINIHAQRGYLFVYYFNLHFIFKQIITSKEQRIVLLLNENESLKEVFIN